MDLLDNIPENNKKITKVKLWLVIVIVLIVILILAAVIIWIYSQNLLKNQFKFYIDGARQSNYAQDLFYNENDNIYVSIKDVATMLGYGAFNGGYKQYTEDITKCYVTNTQEAVAFEANSNKLYKYNIVEGENEEGQTFTINEPVKMIGNKLYIGMEGLKRAFNVQINNDVANNSLGVFTLSYLANYYSGRITNSAITVDTSNFSESVLFNNQKAVLYNLMIVRDETTQLYGVVSLDNPENTLIGSRYSTIEFMEGSNDFIVGTSDGKVGIIGSDGVTKVRLEYDNIVEIDKNLGLYLVTSNNKQGVVNRNGKVIVYQDYDQIGLTTNMNDSNVKNKYILLDNCIPVSRNGLWGLIDINGNEVLPIEYNGIGCIANKSSDSRYQDVVIIPELNGIVVEKDETNGNTNIPKYGLVTPQGRLLVNIVLDNVYAIVSQGEIDYYAVIQNQTINLVDFIYQQQSGSVNENSTNNNNGNENVNTSNTANTSNTNNLL